MASAAASSLFEPLKVGSSQLKHRIVMAPLTRFRANDDHVPLPFVADYYAQRASLPGTLLISEATFIHPTAGGYPNVPGIYNSEQIAAWKKVTDAVHAKGSYIYLQLWALGRTAQPAVLEAEGGKLVGASNIAMEGASAPEPLTEEGIWEFVEHFKQGAKNAIEAGFDGVEIHGANGYLVDQFIQTNTNNRTDAWGGSPEKRSRFALEVAKAVVGAVGKERTAIRLSPFSEFQGMKMDDLELQPTFSYLTRGLKELDLAYLHVVESRVSGNADVEATSSLKFIADIWGKTSPLLIAGGFTADSAKQATDVEYKGYNVAIVFGRYFISNPDLAWRVKNGVALTNYNRETFYNAKEKVGYTDWEFSSQYLAATA